MRGALGVEQRGLKRAFLLAEKLQPSVDLRAAVERRQTFGNHSGNHRRGQLTEIGQQRTALLIELTDHHRTAVHRPVVKLAGQLILDDAALFFDHQNLFQPLGKVMHRHRFKGPAHADLEHADADLVTQRLIDPQLFKCLTHIKVGFAGGDNAEPRLRRIDHHLVELVGPGECPGRIDLVGVEARFLSQRRIRPANVQTAFGQHEILRNTRLDA